MSCQDTLTNGTFSVDVFSATTTTLTNSIFAVPLGTANLTISPSMGYLVLSPSETLPAVTWNMPSAVAYPGRIIFMSSNQNTTTTITLVPFGSDVVEVPSFSNYRAYYLSDGVTGWYRPNY